MTSTRTARTLSHDTSRISRANLPVGVAPKVASTGHFIPVPVVGLPIWNEAIARQINARNAA